MYTRNGWCLWGRVDKRQVDLSEISADAPSVSMLIPKRIQIWYGRQKVVVII